MTDEITTYIGLPMRPDGRGGFSLYVVDQEGALVSLRALAEPKTAQGYRVVGVADYPKQVHGTTGLGIELAADDDRPNCRFGLLLHESTPVKHAEAVAFLKREFLGKVDS